MARVVITGGAGAIGSNLVRALLRESAVEVVIVDDLSSGHEQNIPRDDRVLFLRGSILDQSVLDRAFNRPVERVFHLAANFANLSSIHEPEKDLLVNGMGTLKLLDLARRHLQFPEVAGDGRGRGVWSYRGSHEPGIHRGGDTISSESSRGSGGDGAPG